MRQLRQHSKLLKASTRHLVKTSMSLDLRYQRTAQIGFSGTGKRTRGPLASVRSQEKAVLVRVLSLLEEASCLKLETKESTP